MMTARPTFIKRMKPVNGLINGLMVQGDLFTNRLHSVREKSSTGRNCVSNSVMRPNLNKRKEPHIQQTIWRNANEMVIDL